MPWRSLQLFIFAAKISWAPNFCRRENKSCKDLHGLKITFLLLKIKVGGIKANSKEMPIRCGPGNPNRFN